MAFSPDGNLLASTSCDGTVRLWNPATGMLVHVLYGHNGLVFGVAFSPDRRLLASGGENNTVLLGQAGAPARPGRQAGTLAPQTARLGVTAR